MIADDYGDTPIFRYTRADALRDGVLLDISDTARTCALLQTPTAMTVGLWNVLAPGAPFNSKDERLKEVLYTFLFASIGMRSRRIFETPSANIMVYVLEVESKVVHVKAAAHLDETGQPVCTLMLESED